MEHQTNSIKNYKKVNIVARKLIADPAVELQYIRMAKAGDVRARNVLLEAQLLSLYSLARKRNFVSYRGDATELVDAVAVRFDEIISKFDETRGVRFFTHMVLWARSEMGTELMADRYGVRVPANIFKSGEADRLASCVSGHAPIVDDESITIFDQVADPQVDVFEEAVALEHKRMVAHFLTMLSEEEKYVIKKIYFDEATLIDIAATTHREVSTIRSIRDRAIRKMSAAAKAELEDNCDVHAVI